MSARNRHPINWICQIKSLRLQLSFVAPHVANAPKQALIKQNLYPTLLPVCDLQYLAN